MVASFFFFKWWPLFLLFHTFFSAVCLTFEALFAMPKNNFCFVPFIRVSYCILSTTKILLHKQEKKCNQKSCLNNLTKKHKKIVYNEFFCSTSNFTKFRFLVSHAKSLFRETQISKIFV